MRAFLLSHRTKTLKKMRATKYFKPTYLVGLEEALFQNRQGFNYCLIDESSRQYYVGRTINIAGLIARLRSGVMRVEYPVLAHFLQQTAHTSQMSNWVLAVLADDFDVARIPGLLPDFTPIVHALPFEANSKENAVVYRVNHQRYGVAVHVVSALAPTRGILVSLARKKLRTLRANLESDKIHFDTQYKAIDKVIEHGAPEDWFFTEVPGQDQLEYRQKKDLALKLGVDYTKPKP